MSGAGRRSRSRGELIRRRTQARFVGRRAQLSLFAENLAKDPESESDPAEFLFHVRGVGGVGKSTLLRQWQEAARRAGAATAVVDENDVHGVQQTLAELARQLTEQAGPLKEFERAAEQYRREQETVSEPVPAEGEASLSSRVVAQAALGATSLIPGAGVVTAMADPDAAAQGLDRLRSGARARTRSRRARTGDAAGVSRAFVAELDRLCGRYRWVVLFLDTWERTGRYLDGWLRDLLDDAFGPLPVNVMVVMAGRDALAEREWAPLRALVADVPLEVFTGAETRALLAARGVTEPGEVEAVLHLSMGLPLLVELLALTRVRGAGDVDADGDVVDTAVERFVQWITDARQRETVLACALAPQLNEDVFAAAAPEEARELWGWLCEQPFVGGHGDFKQYHAVVRASMVRQQRTHSPQRWTASHLRLATAHAGWRVETERGLPEAEARRWGDAGWRRHHLDETYHRLCAQPAAHLAAALEQAVHAAGQSTEILQQWTDMVGQAARDTADPALLLWGDRLRNAVADGDPVLAALTALLTHGRLDATGRSWAHTYRGRHLYLVDRDHEAVTELDRAVATDSGNARAWAYRGDVHLWLGRTEQAVSDLTTALELNPGHAWALGSRGEAHLLAGRSEEAIADLMTALDLDPTLARALSTRGDAYRRAGRLDEAVADFTASLDRDPAQAWTLTQRGLTHSQAERLDEAVADYTAALVVDPAFAWALAERGLVHRLAGRLDEAMTDLTAAADLNAPYTWALAQRGMVHRLAGRWDEAVADFTAALDADPAYGWALAFRGETHRQAGRFDEAVADFTGALSLEPGSDWVLAWRGQAHRQAGRLDEALADLSAAVELDPEYGWALAERGAVHRLAGRFDEAVADCTAALAFDPGYGWALAERGVAHRLAGRIDEALADLSAAVELDPEYGWALAERGAVHRLAGRFDEAVADCTAALAFDPGYGWALTERGVAHRLAGRIDEAVADLSAAVGLDPSDSSALAERGVTHRSAGRLDEAEADLTTALDIDPTYAEALAHRGEAHRLAGRLDEAVADFTGALALNPTLDWAFAWRGQTHRAAGRLDEAVADLTAALELEPDDDWALTERGQVHLQAYRHREAVTDFTAALEVNPDSTWARGLRGIAHREAGQYARAREDLEQALAAEPDDLGLLFEKALLETVVSGWAACEEQWRELLVRPVGEPDEDATRFFPLFRVLFLEEEDRVAEAAEVFLGQGPDFDAVTDLLHYLAELSELPVQSGALAGRATHCRRIIGARTAS